MCSYPSWLAKPKALASCEANLPAGRYFTLTLISVSNDHGAHLASKGAHMNQHAVIDPHAIRDRAYDHWRQRGCPSGSAELDWLAAEQELAKERAFREESPQARAKTPSAGAVSSPRPKRARSLVTRSGNAPAARLLAALVANGTRRSGA